MNGTPDESHTTHHAVDGKFSRAFENFVHESNDIVGLLAYARFKQTIRDECMQGNYVTGNLRNPPASTVDVFRSAAERDLSEFASSAIDDARSEIQQSATLNAITSTESSLIELITQRTGRLSSIVTNIVAWLVTLGISALILIVYALPNWQQTLVKAVSEAASPRTYDTDRR